VSTHQSDAVRSPHGICAPQESNNLFERLLHIAATAAGAHAAVSDARSTLTYAEVARLAAAFAAQLEDAGVQPGDHVGVLLGNTREFLIAAFGIWRHRAVLVPLNPQFREPELLGYVRDCQLRSLVTTTRNHSLVQALQQKGAVIDHVWLCPFDSDRWDHRGAPENALRDITKSPLSRQAAPQWPTLEIQRQPIRRSTLPASHALFASATPVE